jgi:hypothetical protein
LIGLRSCSRVWIRVANGKLETCMPAVVSVL